MLQIVFTIAITNRKPVLSTNAIVVDLYRFADTALPDIINIVLIILNHDSNQQHIDILGYMGVVDNTIFMVFDVFDAIITARRY